jgi:hypothetical protein
MTESPETPNRADTDLPQGPGIAFTFIYYFSGAALITALFAAQSLGVGFATGLPGQVGLLGGLVGGSLGVLFNRTRTLEIPVTSPKQMAGKLASTLEAMGYTQTDTLENGIEVYQQGSFRRFFTGAILVQRRSQAWFLVSRAANIRTLKKRLQS